MDLFFRYLGTINPLALLIIVALIIAIPFARKLDKKIGSKVTFGKLVVLLILGIVVIPFILTIVQYTFF